MRSAASGGVRERAEDREREAERGDGHCAQSDGAVRDAEAGGERGAGVAAGAAARGGGGGGRREGADRQAPQADRRHAGTGRARLRSALFHVLFNGVKRIKG